MSKGSWRRDSTPVPHSRGGLHTLLSSVHANGVARRMRHDCHPDRTAAQATPAESRVIARAALVLTPGQTVVLRVGGLRSSPSIWRDGPRARAALALARARLYIRRSMDGTSNWGLSRDPRRGYPTCRLTRANRFASHGGRKAASVAVRVRPGDRLRRRTVQARVYDEARRRCA